MRGLLCGAIGAAAAAAAWLAAEHFQQADYGWMVCLIGLVTGISVKAASTQTTGGFARGAVAIILTLAAILGGRQVYAKIMETTSTGKEPAQIVMDSEEDAADEDAEDTESTPVTTALPEPMEDVSLAKTNYSKSAMKKNMSDRDMLWLCAAALVAYVTGKGGDKAPAEAESASTDAPPESDESPDAPAEENTDQDSGEEKAE